MAHSTTATEAHTDEHQDHHHDDHNPGFVQKYIFSTDHKMIGIQYGLTALCFMLFGFFLMMVMRWSIAYPNQPMPELLTMFMPEDFLNRTISFKCSESGYLKPSWTRGDQESMSFTAGIRRWTIPHILLARRWFLRD